VSCSSLFSLLFSHLFSWEGPSPLSSLLREGPSLFSSLGEVPLLSLLFSTKGGPSPLSSLLSSLLREGPCLFSSLGKAPLLSLLFSTNGRPLSSLFSLLFSLLSRRPLSSLFSSKERPFSLLFSWEGPSLLSSLLY
jgi:hypothetical protein